MARVFVTRQLPGPALQRLSGLHETEIWPGSMPPTYQELTEHACQSDALLSLLTDRIDSALINSCPHLKVIANYAVGYDNVDIAAATARGIPVGNTPDVLTDATADLAFALLMASARRLSEAAQAAREGQWNTWEPAAFLGADIHGASLGIIGMGRIGEAVAQRARGFDMRVLTVGREDPVGLAHVLRGSDFVTIHCPLTPGTRHLINAQTLEMMRPNAILINTARGGIVDQVALARALHNGQIAGAALDVTDPEPLPLDDPLWDAPNLIVVPHIGSATRTAREKMTEMAVENLLAGLDGRPLPHAVGA